MVRVLWEEYLTWVNAELHQHYGIRFPIDEILEQNLAELTPFQPPRGRLLLADDVGIGCLRPIADDVGEIKRMYVRPDARGSGVGRRLLGGLLEAAEQVGYRRVRLDSVRFMEAAHALYRSAGFVEIAPYEGSEIPPEFWDYWTFMERGPRDLRSSTGQRVRRLADAQIPKGDVHEPVEGRTGGTPVHRVDPRNRAR